MDRALLNHAARTEGFSDESAERERRELLNLGSTLIASIPSARESFAEWMAAVEAISDDACTSFSPETALATLTLEFRKLWMRFAHEQADANIKSPLRNATPVTPSGTPIAFGYERDIQPTELEQRCREALPPASGWAADHILFSSAQSALVALLHWGRSAGYWDDRAPRLVFAGNYFETRQVLDIVRGPTTSWRREKTAEAIEKFADGGCRTMLVEPVFYDEGVNVVDLQALQRTHGKAFGGAAGLLIIDTTLIGPLFPINELLQSIAGENAPTVAVFRSGLKLDQAGLELANVGIVSLYCPADSSVAGIGEELRRLRTAMGSGLTFDEISTLEVPWFLDPGYFGRYATSVFENNLEFALAVRKTNKLFDQVLHPQFARPDCPWAHAPYCVLRLHDDEPALYRFLERVIEMEAARRAIPFNLGGSFGFRGDRFEAVVPDDVSSPPYLRIAMGGMRGSASKRATELMCELASYASLTDLERAYTFAGAARSFAPRAAAKGTNSRSMRLLAMEVNQ